MNILNFFLVFAILFVIFGFLYIAAKSLIKNNKYDKEVDKEFDEAVCDFIDETCIVRDKNCNIIKTHTHVITDENGAKQIIIDLKD